MEGKGKAPEVHPHVETLVSYLPHLSEVVRERKLQEKIQREHEEERERVGRLPPLYRLYEGLLKRKVLEVVDDDATVPPRVKERLPLFWSRLVSAFAKLAFCLIVAILTWQNYSSDQVQKYVSLDNGVNDPSSANYDPTSGYRSCLTVPNSLSGKYYLDSAGLWSGTSKFVPGLAKLQLVFNTLELDQAGYEAYVANLNTSISTQVVKGAASRSTAMNLLYKMAWTLPIADNATSSTDYLSFTADPAFVFNRFFKNAALSSATMSCYSIPSITYERAAGNFELKFSMGSPTFTSAPTNVGSGFLADSPTNQVGCCTAAASAYDFNKDTACIVAPRNFGYSTVTDATSLSFKYNIWTVTVALAVNLGVLGYNTMTTVYTSIQNSAKSCFALNSDCWSTTSGTCTKGLSLTYSESPRGCSFLVGGKQWFIEAKMLSRFPGMDPVFCLTESISAKKTAGCFVRLGNSFALPFFNHMGAATKSPADFYNFRSFCECAAPDFSSIQPSSLQSFYTNNQYSDRSDFQGSFWSTVFGKTEAYCQKFDLIHGVILMKGANQDFVLKHFLVNVLQKYTPLQINIMASISGFVAIKTSGSAASQASSTWTVASTNGVTVPETEYITALSAPKDPPQIGWFVAIDGDSAGQEFGQGMFIRDIKSVTAGGTTTFKFKLSGYVKFTKTVTLVASPIEIGNTQVADFKRSMGTGPVSITLYQTVTGAPPPPPPSPTPPAQGANDLTYASNKPSVVVSSVSGLVGNSKMSLKCTCSKAVTVTAGAPVTTNSITYTGGSTNPLIQVGNQVSSVSDSYFPTTGAFITAVNGQTLTLNVDMTTSCSGGSTCSGASFVITTACNNPNKIPDETKILSVPQSQDTTTITLSQSTTSGAYIITDSNIIVSKVAIGSVVTSTSSGVIAPGTYVTSVTNGAATLSKKVLGSTTSITFSTWFLQLSNPTDVGSGESLSCTAAFPANAFSWCTDAVSTDAGSDCVVVAMQTYDSMDQRLNEEGGAPQSSMSCNDDFSMSAAAWAAAAATPPAPLVQAYFKCFNTKLSSFNVGFGVASGIAGSVTPIAVVLIVFLATKVFIPALKHEHKPPGGSKLGGSGGGGIGRVHAINADADAVMEIESADLGDADGDGLVDESELDGFGRVKRNN